MSRASGLGIDSWAARIVVATGELSKAFDHVIDDLYPYLMKYGATQISELHRMPLSTLRRYADGIGRINKAESGKADD